MLQNVSPAASVRQVVVLDEPPGLPSARANTEYLVSPVLFGSGLGSWKAAPFPSVPLASSTLNWPSVRSAFDRLIFALPNRGTKIRWPLLPVMSAVLPWGTPMMLRL